MGSQNGVTFQDHLAEAISRELAERAREEAARRDFNDAWFESRREAIVGRDRRGRRALLRARAGGGK